MNPITNYVFEVTRGGLMFEGYYLADATYEPGPFNEHDMMTGFMIEDGTEFVGGIFSISVANDQAVDTETTGKKVEVGMQGGRFFTGWVKESDYVKLLAALAASSGVTQVRIYSGDPSKSASTYRTVYLRSSAVISVDDLTPQA